MYWDLNVPSTGSTSKSFFLTEMARLGYGGMALNVESDGKKAPPTIEQLALWKVEEGRKPKNQLHALRIDAENVSSKAAVRQLKRFTLQCNDMNVAQSLNSNKVIQAYDIVAVEPQTQRVFQYMCEQGNIDMITIDMASRMPIQLRKPLIDAAIARNIYFEIKYTAALGDSSSRRYFFSNASNLIRVANGRHIVFSSGAIRDMLLRSPYDVINIGILLNLTYSKAMDAISSSCTAIVAHGETRKANGIEIVMKATSINDEDQDMS
ncbi:ribonuclease P protein subunit p30 [Thraustotheca clavata]|uniref:Ribonuclease P protein subunit p30 n=1 Tax=Thraustotheca clavata TaxID=74557 RepID=A0A1V9ZD56_9STRA|nr:ribonuclease P protein subunit p30 [Thraustotheca clavata]